MPDFTMTSQDGKPLKLSDLRGKVVVLTFIYTRCPLPDFCPLMDRKFSELAQQLGAFPERAKDIRLISLSFDPEHDTPEVLRKHAADARGDPAASGPMRSPRTRSWPRSRRRWGSSSGPTATRSPTTSARRSSIREGKLARLEVGTQPNQWDTADLLKTIYSLLPAGAKSSASEPIDRTVVHGRSLQRSSPHILWRMRACASVRGHRGRRTVSLEQV